MGNANKALYSKEQLLYYHINKKEYAKIDQVLTKHPEMLNKPITKDTKHTLLMRAVFSANINSVQFMLNKGADVNAVTPKGQTALTIAIQKNQMEIINMLLEKGANVNTFNPKNGLRPVDLAILPGFLDISKLIYYKTNPKQLKQSFEYQEIAKKFQYRYVNYKTFLNLLKSSDQSEPTSEDSYLVKQKPKLHDPVPDPRQSWGEWLKRNIDFKDAPLVERSSLPPQLQPQNRKLGKLDILVHNWVSLQAQKKSTYKPKEGRQVMSEMNDLVEKAEREGAKDYQSAI